jgi:uncharacterized protein YjbI with pentapeptide repeats
VADISVSPIGARVGYWPRVAIVDLATFIRPGNPISGSRLDTISLSAAAQVFISTAVTSFPARIQAMSQLGRGDFAVFNGGDYSGAAFIGQDLRNAVFESAILKDVSFVNVNLQGARFMNSVVTGANFTSADLRGADLRGAQGLEFSQVQGATFDRSTLFPPHLGPDIVGAAI